MTQLDYITIILLTGFLMYYIGHSFIDAVFSRKEEIIKQMLNSEEGTDG